MVSASDDFSKHFTWSQVQSMSEDILPSVSGHSLIYSETPIKCVYLFGGFDGTRVYNDLWMWKLEDQAWSRLRKPDELLLDQQE